MAVWIYFVLVSKAPEKKTKKWWKREGRREITITVSKTNPEKTHTNLAQILALASSETM